MIPNRSKYHFNPGRDTGSGGGGSCRTGSITPYFCKRCGKTVTPKKVMDGVDVCVRDVESGSKTTSDLPTTIPAQ